MFNKVFLLAIFVIVALTAADVQAVDRFYGRNYTQSTTCGGSNSSFLSYVGGRCYDGYSQGSWYSSKFYNCSRDNNTYRMSTWNGKGCVGTPTVINNQSYTIGSCRINGATSWKISSCYQSAGSFSFAAAAVVMAILASLI